MNEIEGFNGKEVNAYDVYDRCVNSQKCCLPAPTNCQRDVFQGAKKQELQGANKGQRYFINMMEDAEQKEYVRKLVF